MKKPSPLLVALLATPFLASCFSTLTVPVPPPAERQATRIRGVALPTGQTSEDEQVRFSEIFDVSWTEDAVTIVGTLAEGTGDPVTRRYAYDDLSGVLVRQVDAGLTSGIIGAVVVGTVAIVTLLVTGKTNGNTVFDES